MMCAYDLLVNVGGTQFLTQGANVGVDGIGVGRVLIAKHGDEQFFAAEHAPLPMEQRTQQAVFAQGERQGLSTMAYAV